MFLKCWKITENRSEEVPVLFSSQEEADTHLFLHACHDAQVGCIVVIINSEDTDVFILLLAFSPSIDAKLFQRCGSQRRNRMIDINKLVTAVGNDVCNTLAGLHTFTGCDTITAFIGKGKIKPLKLLKSENYVRDAFNRLGQTWEVQSNLHTDLEMFTCQLYSSETSQVNQTRYNFFC